MDRKIIRVSGVYPEFANVFGPPVSANEVEKQLASLTDRDGNPLIKICLVGDAIGDGTNAGFLCTQEENRYLQSIAWRDRTSGYYFSPQNQSVFTEGPDIGGQRTIRAAWTATGIGPRIPPAQLAEKGNPLDPRRGTLLVRMAVAVYTGASPKVFLATASEATPGSSAVMFMNPSGYPGSTFGGNSVSLQTQDFRDHEMRTYTIGWSEETGKAISAADDGTIGVQNTTPFTAPTTWTDPVLFQAGSNTSSGGFLNGDIAKLLLLSDDIYQPIYDDVREMIFSYMAS